MTKKKTADGFCPKHLTPLTPSFDIENKFCFKCETELTASPVVMMNSKGFRITSPPKGCDTFTYYAVIDKQQQDSPYYCYLFQTTKQVRQEIKFRERAHLSKSFSGVEVTTSVECVHWFPSGMSRDMYGVWDKVMVNMNGNHAEIVKQVVDAATEKKIKQQKLKPKYGGSLKPISSVPTTTPAVPTTAAPVSARKPVTPKKSLKPAVKASKPASSSVKKTKHKVSSKVKAASKTSTPKKKKPRKGPLKKPTKAQVTGLRGTGNKIKNKSGKVVNTKSKRVSSAPKSTKKKIVKKKLVTKNKSTPKKTTKKTTTKKLNKNLLN